MEKEETRCEKVCASTQSSTKNKKQTTGRATFAKPKKCGATLRNYSSSLFGRTIGLFNYETPKMLRNLINQLVVSYTDHTASRIPGYIYDRPPYWSNNLNTYVRTATRHIYNTTTFSYCCCLLQTIRHQMTAVSLTAKRYIYALSTTTVDVAWRRFNTSVPF